VYLAFTYILILPRLVQEEFDTYGGCEARLSKSPKFLTERSKIIEIVAAKDIIFALSQSGLCAAFDRGRCSEDEICTWHILNI
jgi:hypothetical protein